MYGAATERAEAESIVQRIWQALAGDPRVDARAHPLVLALEDGTVVIEGEVANVAAKTRAVELAADTPEIRRVVDRLVVEAPVRMEDGAIRDLYGNALLGESAFEESRLVVRADGVEDCLHDPPSPRGRIVATIAGGVVTLSGEAPSLAHARLAGVLAWWIPGTRAVRNALRVDPPEEDNDEEITDAVRIALEKEPLLDAAQLVIRTSDGNVTLSGTLPSAEQRWLAERDAFYVFGVRDVDNRIEVQMR